MDAFPLRGLVYEEKILDAQPGERGSLKQCTLFTEKEIEELIEAISFMDKLFRNIERSIGVELAYNEFLYELQKLKTVDRYSVARVDRLFRAYVMEFRLFLDHWKKYISDLKKKDKRYGSIYEKLYKDVTSEIYDSCEEYVLATVLRNYVVHGYDSIDHCYVDGHNNRIHVVRDNLLRVNISNSAKVIVKQQPEIIDLGVVAEKSLAALQKVQENLINYQLTDEVGQVVLKLVNAKKRIDDAGIQSDFWMLIVSSAPMETLDYMNGLKICRVTDENGKPVQEKPKILPRIVKDVHIDYRALNWDGYIAIALYVKQLWEKDYWEDIQKKYALT